MGHIHRSHRRLPTCTYSHPVSKVPQVSFPRCHLPVHQPTLRASNSPPHFHRYSQGSKTDSLTIRNQAPPIPGRLVNPCPLKTGMHGADPKTAKAGEGFGLYSKPQEVRPHTFTDVRLPRIPFLLDLALVKPMQDRWTKLQEMFHRLSMKSVISARTLMSTIGLLASMEKTIKLGRMHMRSFQWHLKTH